MKSNKYLPLSWILTSCILITLLSACKKSETVNETSVKVPTIITSGVNSVTAFTAKSGGNCSDGGAPVTERGVCWDTLPNPTIEDNLTKNGPGSSVFSSDIYGLNPNTTYYLRAYATNNVGIGYGNEISFKTQDGTIELTTSAITKNFGKTAISGGSMTKTGGTTAYAKGICWSTSPHPTISDNTTTDGAGNAPFISNMSNLTPSTVYYIRAYASNILGTYYGNEISFTTSQYYLGRNFGGGIIFYLEATGIHGLIAAGSDQSTDAPWGCYGTNIPGTVWDLGSGKANTTAIVNGCPAAGTSARICNDLLLNGYSDWYLPSIDEIEQLYRQRSLVGGFGDDVYWTSCQGPSPVYAFVYSFINGSFFAADKSRTDMNTRAIRSF